MERYILSIDAGTSMVKAILFTMRGRIVSRADRPCELECPEPDHYEMDLDRFYVQLCDTIRECIAKASVDPGDIQVIGASAYMTGTILLDASGELVGENIVWIDGRTMPLLREWEASGLSRKSFQLTGTSLLPGHTLPLLCWWKQNRPEVLDRTACQLYMKDWIRFKLTGEIGTDPSEATCLPSDTFARSWSAEVMKLYGMEAYMHILPPIHPSEEIVGRVHRRAAQDTGLREGTPVVCGLGDMLAGVLGAGATAAGDGVTILGTTLLNSIIQDQPDIRPEGIGMTLATVNDKWVRFLNNTGGGTINSGWAMDILTEEKRRTFQSKEAYYDWLNAEVQRVNRGADGVMYHPYINSTGVTAPFYCVGARAQFTGIGLHHTSMHLMRAVYEGIAMAIRHCYDATRDGTDSIRISGGGSHSEALCQIVADVCQKELLLPEQAEATALGTAILGAYAVGEYGSIAEAVSAMVSIGKRYEPDPSASSVYDEWFGLYKKTAAAMVPVWDARTECLERIRAGAADRA